MAYTGDVPSNLLMPAHTSILRNAGNTAFICAPLDNRQYSLTIRNPAAFNTVMISYIHESVYLTSVDAICPDGTSVQCIIKDQTTPYAVGTTIGSVTATTSGASSSLTYNMVAGNWLILFIGTVSGTVSGVTVIINGYVK